MQISTFKAVDYNSDEKFKLTQERTQRTLNFERIHALRLQLEPLTLPYVDYCGRIIQLWKSVSNGLLGAVLESNSTLILISANKISTPLNPSLDLVCSLQGYPLKKWDIVFDARKLSLAIWPHLEAAGLYDGKSYDQVMQDAQRRLNNMQHEKKGGLNRYHYTACQHEGKGRTLMGKDGKPLLNPKDNEPYDHRGDVCGSQKAAKNLIKDLNTRLGKGGLTDEEIKNLNDFKIKVGKVLDESKRYAPLARPATQNFKENVQKNGLTGSYNNNNAGSPIAPRGAMSGEMGGVGCNTELIEGLFGHADALFEEDHLFFLPSFGDNQIPMTDQELRQILRELARGIFVHDAVPFFSLHFNQNSDLYPVIDPVYENTLVGQVISLLDYFMKGYLNGGVFSENFIMDWELDPNWDRKKTSALQEMIDFSTYCKTHLQGEDQKYISLRQILNINSETEVLQKLEDQFGAWINNEPAIFKDTSLFSNSFRIISKQKSIQKVDNLFVLDADFDVFYTIEPAPAYKMALEQYQKLHGRLPFAYQMMVQAYEHMKELIHDHMVKLPICSKYFSMLKLINFFSSYFMTLKKNRKIPIFTPIQGDKTCKSPALFPHLPLENLKKETLSVNNAEIIGKFCLDHTALISQYFTQPTDLRKEALIETLGEICRENILSLCSFPMSRHLKKNPRLIDQGLEQGAKMLLDLLQKTYNKTLASMSDELNQFGSKENVTKMLENSHTLREMWSIKYSLIKAVTDDKNTLNSFNQIRDMPESEFKEMEEQMKLLLMEKNDLSKYIIQQLLPKILDNKKTEWLEIKANPIYLPNEADDSAILQGKRVVGGCGMELKPLKVIPSLLADSLLHKHWSALAKLETETWINISNEDGNEVQGAIFKLAFDNLPVDQDDDYAFMEYLFDGTSLKEASILSSIRSQFITAINDDEIEAFDQLIRDSGKLIQKIVDPSTGETLVHLAARQKNSKYLQKLLAAGLSAMIQDKQKYLPVHYAAMHGSEDCTKLLLDLNVHMLNAQSNNKATALIIAIQHGQKGLVKLLLDRKASITTVTAAGYTPLHSALHHGDEDIIMDLFAHIGLSEVNQATEEGVTPLMLACDLNSEKLVREILKKGANPNLERKDGFLALDLVVQKNFYTLCEILLPISKLSNWTIETAVKESSLDILKLIAAKANFVTYCNYSKDTPLILAVRYGNTAAAMHILSLSSATVINAKNVFEETAISLSVASGFDDVTQALIKKGAQENPKQLLLHLCRQGLTPFLEEYLAKKNLSSAVLQELVMAAAKAGQHLVISQLLIPKGANLDLVQGPKGWKIEHYLVKSDALFLLKQRVLTSKNYLNRLVSSKNKTLAYLAAEHGSWKCFQFLLDLMIKNNISLTEQYHTHHLAYAVIESENVEALGKLIAHEPMLIDQCLDDLGTRPVHLATKKGSKEVLKFLQSKQANFNQEDNFGHTALYYAIQANCKGLVKFLISQCNVQITAESLYLAFSKNQTENLLLLNAAAHLNVQSSMNQNTPLLFAIKNNDYAAFAQLMERGASLNCINAEGWTPMLLVCDSGQSEMLEAILNRGYVDQRVYKGDNALHLACKNGNPECVKLLLSAGFSPQVPNGDNKLSNALARHSVGASAALGIKGKEYSQILDLIHEAFREKKPTLLEKPISLLSVNEILSIHNNGKKFSGTLLHLILRLMGQSKSIRPIIDKLMSNPTIDLQLSDSEGCSYAHLLVMAQIIPKNLNLSAVNHDGETPLHLAVKSCDEYFLDDFFKTTLVKNVINTPNNHGESPLFYAITANKSKNAIFLLDNGANPDHQDLKFHTPLILACSKNDFPLVKRLIAVGANINQCGTVMKVTPLAVSLAKENDEITFLLMSQGADLHLQDKDGSTFAHMVAASGKVHILRFLSSKGISLDQPNKKGIRPIHIAAGMGHNHVLEFFLSLNISLETTTTITKKDEESKLLLKNAKAIHFASMAGKVDTVQWLINHHVNIESQLNNEEGILFTAAQADCTQLIEMFKKYKFSQKTKQIFPAIQSALYKDYPKSAMALYELGVPINADILDAWTGLHLACKWGSVRTTPKLLDLGANYANVDREGATCLEIAAANKSVDQFWQMLVSVEPKLDNIYKKGNTLLHIAVDAGNLAHAILLIDNGISLDIQNDLGETALHMAARKGYLEIVGLLIGLGSDASIKTHFDKTPRELTENNSIWELLDRYQLIKDHADPNMSLLHLAVQAKILEAVKLLTWIKDVNEKGGGGKTALHLSVEADMVTITRLLLTRGAELETQDAFGYTPLATACLITQKPLMVRFLINAGANRLCFDKAGETILEALEKNADFNSKKEIIKLLKDDFKNELQKGVDSFLKDEKSTKSISIRNNLNQREIYKKSTTNRSQSGKSNYAISKKEIIARDLWLNIHTLISDDTEKKVNLISDYLKIKGFELVGAKGDGDCFCHSFIESYKTFSKKIPVFDQAKDQVQYLKDCISSQYGAIFPQAFARIDELKQKGQFLCADGEGDLIAKVLKIPIRVVKAEVNKDGSGINDMLTWPEKNKESEQWGNIDKANQPRLNEYIFIVDLEGHFVAARPIVKQGL